MHSRLHSKHAFSSGKEIGGPRHLFPRRLSTSAFNHSKKRRGRNTYKVDFHNFIVKVLSK